MLSDYSLGLVALFLRSSNTRAQYEPPGAPGGPNGLGAAVTEAPRLSAPFAAQDSSPRDLIFGNAKFPLDRTKFIRLKFIDISHR